MEEIIKKLFKIGAKLLITPFLIGISLLILIVYIVVGFIVVPSQSIRFLGLTIIAAVKSAFDNVDYTNKFLDALFEFLKKYISFFKEIIYIPLAIWVSAAENPSNLADLIKYEWKLLSDNWLSTILIYASLILSISFSFVMVALNSIDYFHLNEIKQKLYQPFEGFSNDSITGEDSSELRLVEKVTFPEKANIIEAQTSLDENIKQKYEREIDSLNKVLIEKKESPRDNRNEAEINDLKAEIERLRNQKPATRTETRTQYVEKPVYIPSHPYGAGRGRVYFYLRNNGGNCSQYFPVKIFVNGVYQGSLNDSYEYADCNSSAIISYTDIAGNYSYKAEGRNGASWTGNNSFYIQADQCMPMALNCK